MNGDGMHRMIMLSGDRDRSGWLCPRRHLKGVSTMVDSRQCYSFVSLGHNVAG